MKSLLELLNIELEQFPNYKSVGCSNVLELITDDEAAAKFINHLNYEDEEVFEFKNTIPISQGRARHSVISFLLGLVIGKFKGLFGSLSSAFNDNTVQYIEEINEPYIEYWLWMLVSTNHDYGYYSKYVSQKIDLSDIEVKYDLFYDDNSIPYEPLHNFEEKYPKVLKLPYEKIKNYFDYSKFYHEKEGDHEELCDHGILGGVLIYDKAVSKIASSLTDKEIKYSMSDMNRPNSVKDILFYKAICLTIAQHNIFKSSSDKKDEDYKNYGLDILCYDSDYFIDVDTPILALLTLVDTIECVKRFSRAENDESYLTANTVLSSIKLSVSENEIILDFSDLKDRIKKKGNEDLTHKFEEYKNGILRMETWTKFQAYKIDANIISIQHCQN